MAWLKRNAVALLAGLVAVLGGIVAWGAFKRRTGALKDAVQVERARAATAGAKVRAQQAAADGKRLERVDQALAGQLVEVVARKEAQRAETEKLSDVEVVQQLNQLYVRKPPYRGAPAPVRTPAARKR